MRDLIKTITIALPVCGLIFQAGKQSEKVDDLYAKMDVQVIEQKSIRDILHSMDTKLCIIEQDIKHMLIVHQKPS
jgi:hypothetical protein